MNKMLRFSIPVLVALLAMAAWLFIVDASAHSAASEKVSTRTAILVTSLEDELNSDGDCALREAIQAVNTNAAVDACPAGDVLTDTITFGVAGTITVTSQLEILAGGGPLMIDGGEAITVSGGGTTRVFFVNGGIDLTIQRLAVTNGYGVSASGAGLYNDSGNLTISQCAFVGNHFTYIGLGGGIFSSNGTLTVLDSRFEANGATEYMYSEARGGGIAIVGSLGGIYRSTFLRNNVYNSLGCAWGAGGAAIMYAGDSLIVQDSSFISNTSLNGGGAISNEGTMTLTNNTFTGNSAASPCSMLPGGAIANYGSMTILSNTISGNTSGDGGAGGIINNVSMTLIDSNVSDNTSVTGGAGGIINMGSLAIIDSTVSNNIATNGGAGGAISHVGSLLTIANSTISGNRAASGGGIDNHAALTITNSTFSGNTATNGGGINSPAGALTIVNTTFSGNGAVSGGGIKGGDGNTILTNTIVADSPVGGDCAGAITDGGHNLASDNTCGLNPANGSLPNTDPLLGPLQDNGGTTWTYALPQNSPAVDAGDNPACPPLDQRGILRPIDGDGDGEAVCDMGAYEFQPGVYIHPPEQSGSGLPGGSVDYLLTFYNWSPLTDTYHIELGPHAWPTELSAAQVGPLEPGGAESFIVTVSIPLNTPWYHTDSVVVTATSLTSPSVYFAKARVATGISGVAPAEVAISGPQTGWLYQSYTFTAAVSPISTTLPVTYTWLITGQAPILHTDGLSDTVSIAWDAQGVYTLTVSAANFNAAADTMVITILPPILLPQRVYLPLAVRR